MNFDLNKIFKKKFLFKKEGFAKLLTFNYKVITAVIFSMFAVLSLANYGMYFVALVTCFEIAYCSKHKRIWQSVAVIVYILTFRQQGTAILLLPLIISLALILVSETVISKKEMSEKEIKITNGIQKFYQLIPVKIICTFAYPLQLAVFALIRLANN